MRAGIGGVGNPAAHSGQSRLVVAIHSATGNPQYLGLPRVLPLLFALANPDFTRSLIMDRSNSAKTPIIWNMARPLGVVVSSACWCK